MDPMKQHFLRLSRRQFLGRATTGIGSLALSSLLNPRLFAAESPVGGSLGVVNPLHHPAKAKRIIYLYMAGGPAHLELLDYKPKLVEMSGKPMPDSITAGQPIAQLQNSTLRILAPSFPFAQHGKSGQELSSLLPYIASIADDICIIRSMHTEQINHDPAHTFMNTGTSISGRPSMGSWMTYGLGSEAENLPGFVVMVSTGQGGQNQPIAQRQWHSGFLPSKFQGVQFNSKGDAVHYIANPGDADLGRQRDIIETVSTLNEIHDKTVDDPEIAARISQYEMAFKMQTSVPDLMDISGESKETLDMYGLEKLDGTFAANCLIARRMAERGVRFIQLYHRDWDHHNAIANNIPKLAAQVDQPAAALIKDLKQRGMLDDTLVIWGGEFGRTPMAQQDGRDHHIKGFSIWMAGGGIKGGVTHGATDEFGYNAEQNPVHVHDFHATMLHLMGVDHKKLTYRFQGREFRLTDVSGNVVREILT